MSRIFYEMRAHDLSMRVVRHRFSRCGDPRSRAIIATFF